MPGVGGMRIRAQESGFRTAERLLHWQPWRSHPAAPLSNIQEHDVDYVYAHMDSPVGRLKLVARGEKLAAVLWERERPGRVRLGAMREAADHPALQAARRQLTEYFAGQRHHFDLALDFAGTAFQKQVWHALLTIPYGQTRSYREIAAQIGKPDAVRAVGAANGRNPLSIVAPCHRVIATSGKLTGFAGGLENKAWLLALENATQRLAA